MSDIELKKYYIKDIKEYPFKDYIINDDNRNQDNENVEINKDNGINENINNDSKDELNELSLEDTYEYKIYKKDKQIKPFMYFTKKQFETFSGDYPTKVIGNVNFNDLYKEKTEKDLKDNNKKSKKKKDNKLIGVLNIKYTDKYIDSHANKKFNDEYTKTFKVFKPENKACIGYLYIGETSFIRIEKHSAAILIILLFLIAAFIIFAGEPDDIIPFLPIGGEDYDGSQNNNKTTPEIEYIEIPVYQDLFVNADKPYIALRNPSGNTVYFTYDVYIDEDADGYVDTSTAKPIFHTDLIPEGQMVRADLHSILEKGEYTLYFKVGCYDVATQSQCDGSNITNVSITVK